MLALLPTILALVYCLPAVVTAEVVAQTIHVGLPGRYFNFVFKLYAFQSRRDAQLKKTNEVVNN